MGSKVINSIDFTHSLCTKILPFLEPLSQQFGVKTFGYRKFFPDGTSSGISTNPFLTNTINEKFGQKFIPSYEEEISQFFRNDKSHFFRIGKPDTNNAFFSMLYELDVWNTLCYYRQCGDCVEGFYFAADKSNEAILEQYLNYMHVFERFSLYFKDKLTNIISSDDLNLIRAKTLSPHVFEKGQGLILQNSQDIKNFISNIPIQKFFLTAGGKDHCLTIQEFKCLSLLSRGKTSKEVGLLLNISSRTVEGYIENIKNKIKIGSRSQLIDLFISNFQNDKNYIFPLENFTTMKCDTCATS